MRSNIAGYVICSSPPVGQPGTAYTYELAGNGLFLEAHNAQLRVRIPLAEAQVRGLPALEPYLHLIHGKVPSHLLELVASTFGATPDQERYAAIVWEGEYSIRIPSQDCTAGSIHYETIPNTVVNLHSHPGQLGAFFSGTDNRDDQGFQVSVVVAEVSRLIPCARARVCLYGYFWEAPLAQVFEGALSVREGPVDESEPWY